MLLASYAPLYCCLSSSQSSPLAPSLSPQAPHVLPTEHQDRANCCPICSATFFQGPSPIIQAPSPLYLTGTVRRHRC